MGPILTRAALPAVVSAVYQTTTTTAACKHNHHGQPNASRAANVTVMHPVVPSGGGYAPPPVVPVYAPGQLQPQPQKASPPSKPAAPQVTTLLVTETVPPSANGTAASLGVIGGM